MRQWQKIVFPLLALSLLTFAAGGTFIATHPGALNRLGLDLHSAFFPAPPPCDGDCEGQDPYQTQCNMASGPGQHDASYVANEVGIYDRFGHKLLVVQNWYSPRCQTNWALAYIQYPEELIGLSIRSVDNQGKEHIYCNITINCSSENDFFAFKYMTIPVQPIYTRMTVAPSPIIACATGIASSPFDPNGGLNPERVYADRTCA